MGERMIRQNYEVMIQALYDFGAKTAEIADQIHSAANTCRDALGEEDTSIVTIYENVNRCRRGYDELAMKALKIAREMGEELQRAEEELHLWSEEE